VNECIKERERESACVCCVYERVCVYVVCKREGEIIHSYLWLYSQHSVAKPLAKHKSRFIRVGMYGKDVSASMHCGVCVCVCVCMCAGERIRTYLKSTLRGIGVENGTTYTYTHTHYTALHFNTPQAHKHPTNTHTHTRTHTHTPAGRSPSRLR
jgi:hypothetical protein